MAASSAQIGGFGGAHGVGPGIGPVGHGGHGGHGLGHGGHGGGHGGHGYGHEIYEIIPYHYNYAVADSYTGARFDQASSVSPSKFQWNPCKKSQTVIKFDSIGTIAF